MFREEMAYDIKELDQELIKAHFRFEMRTH